MEKISMRRLVIGIMLALFAVGAYSQGDDIYVYQNSKKEKSAAMKSYMASLNIPSEDEVKEKVFKSLCGEWRMKDGSSVTISEKKIEIEGVVTFTSRTTNKINSDILIGDRCIYIDGLHYTWNHPLFGEYDENCRLDVEVFDEERIILTVRPSFTESKTKMERVYIGTVKTFNLTRAK